MDNHSVRLLTPSLPEYSRAFAVMTAICMLAANLCSAQQPTARSTRMVVGLAAGGPVDTVARALAEGLSKELAHPVIVENRPGANGNIAAELVAKSPPDGSVLFLTSVGATVISPLLYRDLPYDPARDFALISQVANNVEVLVVPAADRSAGAAEFVASSRRSTNPVPFGSTGIGSIGHLTIELFAEASGARLLHVPYKGVAQLLPDLLSGQVGGFFTNLPGMLGHIQSGRIRALGVGSAKRHPMLPNVPTFAEQGIHGADTNNWYAVVAPAKTPAAVVNALGAAIRRALQSEPAHSKLLALGAEPTFSTPDELAELIRNERGRWSRVIRERQITGE